MDIANFFFSSNVVSIIQVLYRYDDDFHAGAIYMKRMWYSPAFIFSRNDYHKTSYVEDIKHHLLYRC